MKRGALALMIALAALAAGCSLHPDYNGTTFACEADQTCPAGYACVADRCLPDAPPPATCAAAISAGVNYACAVRDDGTAWCWGQNTSGQLGDNTTEDRVTPVAVVATGLPKLAAVSTGFAHTCALGVDHSVWCWGANGDGQLGNGTTSDNHAPVKVTAITNASAVVAAGRHTCALEAGAVKCWGNNFFGQLGNGSTGASSVPVAVQLAGGATALGLAAANSETCVVDSGHAVQCWGANDAGQLGNATTAPSDQSSDPATKLPVKMQLPADRAVQVAVGADFACALLDDGTVFCTGHNNANQVGPHTPGVDNNDDFVLVPRQVPLNVTAKALVVGDRFSCITDDAAKLWCWGADDNFEIADGGGPHDRAFPVQVDYPDAKLASAGAGFLCVQSSDGLRCGGYDGFGQLGDGHRTTSSVPLAVDGLTGLTAVTAGASFSCAVRGDQSVACWGENDSGQLGDGTLTPRARPVPVVGLHGVVKLVSAHRHSCALLGDATVACWGGNSDGQLGDGSFVDRPLARPVLATDKPATPLANVIDIAVGAYHSCAVLQGGAVKCWGNNFQGQLGSGTPGSNDQALPTDLAAPGAPAGVTKIAAGVEHTCVIADAGKIWCWGANQLGQLGIDRPNDAQMIPRQTVTPQKSLLPAGLAFDQVSAFTDFTCAHATSNDVWCWGYNNDGELGLDGTSFFEAVPKQSSGLVASQVTAGEIHGCAITAERAAVCWGGDYLGQVGQDNYDAYPTRQMVAGLTGVQAIAAGANHSCAIVAGGGAACWGDGRDGELGNGIRLSDHPVAPALACPQ
ncbi:MAG TPA: hypothetical protein VFP84_00195 [Kofleriaceae bacterium]|nr:hypothetical protein [Kofleriaceae bacterium]